MGQVVTLSAPSVDLALYGDRSNFVQDYLQQQINQLGGTLNNFGERIYNSLANSWNFVTDGLTRVGLRTELEQQGLNVVDNYFVECNNWIALQEANLTMQRWIMANPQVRELYLGQDICGYSDEYVDLDPGKMGEDHYDYRRVMNGIIRDEPNGDYTITHYYEDLHIGDRELEFYEQEPILHTWSAIDYMLGVCDFDFTAKTEEPTKINR